MKKIHTQLRHTGFSIVDQIDLDVILRHIDNIRLVLLSPIFHVTLELLVELLDERVDFDETSLMVQILIRVGQQSEEKGLASEGLHIED